ncbi:MAG: helix-turn-helix domain-containing protein [Terrimicrobiaceae bacterium]
MPRTCLLRSKSHFPDPQAPVSINRQRAQPPVQAHRHEFVEIVLVLSGSGVHGTGEIRHEIRTGDVLVIHGGRSHAYEDARFLHLVNVLVRRHVLDDAAKELGGLSGYHPLFTFEFARWRPGEFRGHLRLNSTDLGTASAWVDAIEEEIRHGTEGAYFLARSWLMLLLGLLARNYGKNGAVSSCLDMRLGRVLSRIDQDPTGRFPLGELAGQAAMSPRSFLRYFKTATGFSPADYVIRSRIRRAEEMLVREDGKLSVTEIAFRCGFQDSNYFSRQFRRVTGKTPRSYRR